MAQLYRRPKSPFWWAKFMFDGQMRRFSTEQKTRKEAAAVLARKIAESRGERGLDVVITQLFEALVLLPPPKQAEARSKLAHQLMATKESRLALAVAWEVWKGNPRSRTPSPNTLAGYSAIWDRLHKWMKEQHPDLKYLDEITPSLAESYAANLLASKVTPRTYNAHVSFLLSFFKAMRVRAGLIDNPWGEIPRQEGAAHGRRELTVKELVAVIKNAPPDLRTLFLISAYTGMRLGDTCLLTWKSVRYDDNVIEYTPMKTARKGKVIRVPMNQYLVGWLKQIEPPEHADMDPVSPEIAATYRKDRVSITNRIQAHFNSCGITTVPAPAEGAAQRRRSIVEVGFHSLRHSFVSLCAANQVPQVAVMEMVGHGSPAMTRLYSHAGKDQKKRAIAKLPALMPK